MKKTVGLTLGILAGLSFAGEARAQSLRPNMMFIFDTSGSMLDNQNNDGSDPLQQQRERADEPHLSVSRTASATRSRRWAPTRRTSA